MRRLTVTTLVVLCVAAAGCEALRYAPGQAQKQNAWLHNRTALIAAQTARDEDTSARLQALTGLCEVQSRAFMADYGLPAEPVKAETAEDVLDESNYELASVATAEAAARPDAWDLADSTLDLAIGLAGLLGGVYGTRAVRFLNKARTKTKALKEIIEGNEVFKDRHKEYAEDFKDAHSKQSPETKQLVTVIKG